MMLLTKRVNTQELKPRSSSLMKLMRRRSRNAGLTLVEVLATLVITGIALTAILYLTNQTHSGVKHIAAREQIIDESRLVVNHIVQSSRKEKATPQSDAAHPLILQYASGNRTEYSFDPSTRQISYTSTIDGRKTTGVLSTHVGSILVKSETLASSQTRLVITLMMSLPGGESYDASTVVNLPSL